MSTPGVSGIDRIPTALPVAVEAPGAGLSGLSGDPICDTDFHGGPHQAVYAYAREDLDAWGPTSGRCAPGRSGRT